MQASLTAIGDWDKQIGVPLQTAMMAGVELVGGTGEKWCRKALYYMAESAQKETPIAKQTRPVSDNPQFAHLLRKEQYKAQRMRGANMARYFQRTAKRLRQPPNMPQDLYGNDDTRISKVSHVGLGVRSWQWGLRAMGGRGTNRRPIAGTTEFFALYGKNAGPRLSGVEAIAGYVLRNKLGYIMRIMKPGWEQRVEKKAANRIMGQARNVLRREFARAMSQNMKTVKKMGNRKLSDYFRVAA